VASLQQQREEKDWQAVAGRRRTRSAACERRGRPSRCCISHARARAAEVFAIVGGCCCQLRPLTLTPSLRLDPSRPPACCQDVCREGPVLPEVRPCELLPLCSALDADLVLFLMDARADTSASASRIAAPAAARRGVARPRPTGCDSGSSCSSPIAALPDSCGD
jgi:hypothetical protein